MSNWTFLLTLCFIISLYKKVAGFHLQLFEDVDFEGLVFETDLISQNGEFCTRLPEHARSNISSLTTDECLIFYNGEVCNDKGTGGESRKILPGSYRNLTEKKNLGGFLQTIGSFHLCNENMGGAKIKVVLSKSIDGPSLIAYENLCDCENLPRSCKGKVHSVNNFGNCVTLFTERNCGGTSLILPGGRSAASDDLSIEGFGGLANFIQPCVDEMPVSCVKLSSTIIDLKIQGNLTNLGPKEFSIGSKTAQEIPSVFQILENQEFSYEVHSHLSGKIGRREMSSEEVKFWTEKIGLEYTGDFDNSTVKLKGSGNIFGDVSLNSLVIANGTLIKPGDCALSLNFSGNSSTSWTKNKTKTAVGNSHTEKKSTKSENQPIIAAGQQPKCLPGLACFTTCGGVLTPDTGAILYKASELLSPNERCVWIIQPKASENYTSFDILLLTMGFEPKKGEHQIFLQGIHYMGSGAELIPGEIAKLTIMGNLLMITFYTGKDIGDHTGFYIIYTAGHKFNLPNKHYAPESQHLRFNYEDTTIIFPPPPRAYYSVNELSSILYHPANSTELELYNLEVQLFNVSMDFRDFMMCSIFRNFSWNLDYSCTTTAMKNADMFLIIFNGGVTKHDHVAFLVKSVKTPKNESSVRAFDPSKE